MAKPHSPKASATGLPYWAGGNPARLFLAAMVVLNHLGALTGLYRIKAFNADLAVECFFVLSGFAMMHSYQKLLLRFRLRAVLVFYIQRFFRIVVTVWAIVLLQVVCLFPLSSLPLSGYLGADLSAYVLANACLLNNLQQSLPGVFLHIPSQVVNGSLWTMKVEWLFYLLFPLLFVGLGKAKGTYYLIIVIILSLIYRIVLTETHPAWSIQTPGQLMFFGAGMLLYKYFEQIRFQKAFATLGIILLVKAMFWRMDLIESFFAIPLIAYGLCFSLQPVDTFFKQHDYSFTIYLLHWPIIQAGVDLFFRHGKVLEGLVFIVLLLLVGSWCFQHYIEQPILAWGKRIGNKAGAKPIA